MQRTTKYVGLDVHPATTVASVREEQVGARPDHPADGGRARATECLHSSRRIGS